MFEAYRVTLSKAIMFVKKGYMTGGLFKMNVMTVILTLIKRIFLLFMCLSLSPCSMVDYNMLIMILCVD